MIKNILQQSKWRVFNIDIARRLGLNETLVLMELADAESYFRGEWFFLTYDQISENTTLTEYLIRKVVKNLKKQKIIVTKMQGIPPKQYFKIDENSLDKLLRNIPTKFDRNDGIKSDRNDGIKSDRNNGIKSDRNNGIKSVRNIYKEPINKKPINKEPIKHNTETSSVYSKIKILFLDYYKNISGTEYYFSARDGSKIKSIIKKIKHAYVSNNKLDPSDNQIVNGFEHILKRAAADNWIVQNFTLSIIDSQFNKLKSKRNKIPTDYVAEAIALIDSGIDQ